MRMRVWPNLDPKSLFQRSVFGLFGRTSRAWKLHSLQLRTLQRSLPTCYMRRCGFNCCSLNGRSHTCAHVILVALRSSSCPFQACDSCGAPFVLPSGSVNTLIEREHVVAAITAGLEIDDEDRARLGLPAVRASGACSSVGSHVLVCHACSASSVCVRPHHPRPLGICYGLFGGSFLYPRPRRRPRPNCASAGHSCGQHWTAAGYAA
jgi:hypothetical protein